MYLSRSYSPVSRCVSYPSLSRRRPRAMSSRFEGGCPAAAPPGLGALRRGIPKSATSRDGAHRVVNECWKSRAQQAGARS